MAGLAESRCWLALVYDFQNLKRTNNVSKRQPTKSGYSATRLYRLEMEKQRCSSRVHPCQR